VGQAARTQAEVATLRGTPLRARVIIAPMAWPQMQTGKPVDPAVATTFGSSGIGLIRPLEAVGPQGRRADSLEAPDVEPD